MIASNWCRFLTFSAIAISFALGNTRFTYDLSKIRRRGITIRGASSFDRIGNDMNFIGDFNCDGFDDIVIGAKHEASYGDNTGAAYVVYGYDDLSRTIVDLLTATPDEAMLIRGDEAGDFFGESVDKAGDVNGDGCDDIIIGAKFGEKFGLADSGLVYVVYGMNTTDPTGVLEMRNLTQSQGIVIAGFSEGGEAGEHVSWANDWNNDGFGDIMLGADEAERSTDFEDEGQVYLVYGSDSLTNFNLTDWNSSQGVIFSGGNAGDGAGFGMDGATDDMNADGLTEVLIGTKNGDRYYIVWGSSDGYANLTLTGFDIFYGIETIGEQKGSKFGRHINIVTDMNGDDIGDIGIGAPQYNDSLSTELGAVFCFYGRNLQLVPESPVFQRNLVNRVGFGVFWGNGTKSLVGDGRHSRLGETAAGADFNGNGEADFIVGAQGGGPDNTGAVYALINTSDVVLDIGDFDIYLSDVGGEYRINELLFVGDVLNDSVGIEVDGGFDFNSDGLEDIAISGFGAEGNDGLNRTDQGEVYLLFGGSFPSSGPINTAGPTPAPTPFSPTYEPTAGPTTEPTHEPTAGPSTEPTHEPTAGPTTEPTGEPFTSPTFGPTAEPTHEPTAGPSAEPTMDPTAGPTTEPTGEPFTTPTFGPTAEPTHEPTAGPTAEPTFEPSAGPTAEPTGEPFTTPTLGPTAEPTHEPTAGPTTEPTLEPTAGPTTEPTLEPTAGPTTEPTLEPTAGPTTEPTAEPTFEPSAGPTTEPTAKPTAGPTTEPTMKPTTFPTSAATLEPTHEPTVEPTKYDCLAVKKMIRAAEQELKLLKAFDKNERKKKAKKDEISDLKKLLKSKCATPTPAPTIFPTMMPTTVPTIFPTPAPSVFPTLEPTPAPSDLDCMAFNQQYLTLLDEVEAMKGDHSVSEMMRKAKKAELDLVKMKLKNNCGTPTMAPTPAPTYDCHYYNMRIGEIEHALEDSKGTDEIKKNERKVLKEELEMLKRTIKGVCIAPTPAPTAFPCPTKFAELQELEAQLLHLSGSEKKHQKEMIDSLKSDLKEFCRD